MIAAANTGTAGASASTSAGRGAASDDYERDETQIPVAPIGSHSESPAERAAAWRAAQRERSNAARAAAERENPIGATGICVSSRS
ncbi:hypothetical protein CJ026_025770 [Ralstonia pickettii]|nr:hypothetical protein CJ026_025935 [Ralstonia pickettii]POH85211.1 hypothetical protein CJ026_025770 [Ralstonia pickettii]